MKLIISPRSAEIFQVVLDRRIDLSRPGIVRPELLVARTRFERLVEDYSYRWWDPHSKPDNFFQAFELSRASVLQLYTWFLFTNPKLEIRTAHVDAAFAQIRESMERANLTTAKCDREHLVDLSNY